jgi:hypothetical protein
MSPLKVERESVNLGKDTFIVPNGKKFTIELTSGGRINLYGSFLGGYVERIEDLNILKNKTTTRLSYLDEPISFEVKQKHERTSTRFTFTGVLF